MKVTFAIQQTKCFMYLENCTVYSGNLKRTSVLLLLLILFLIKVFSLENTLENTLENFRKHLENCAVGNGNWGVLFPFLIRRDESGDQNSAPCCTAESYLQK